MTGAKQVGGFQSSRPAEFQYVAVILKHEVENAAEKGRIGGGSLHLVQRASAGRHEGVKDVLVPGNEGKGL